MKLPFWRFLIPLAIQLTIVFAITIVPLTIVLTGKTVFLQTIAFDPYDLLRGYSQVLDYEFRSIENLKKLPGALETFPKQEDNNTVDQSQYTEYYVIFVAPKTTNSIPPQAWKPQRVTKSLPLNLPADQVAIRGQIKNYQITYGIEELYIPEAIRQDLNQAVAEANQKQEGLVEVKVGRSGQAILRSLWLGKTKYQF